MAAIIAPSGVGNIWGIRIYNVLKTNKWWTRWWLRNGSGVGLAVVVMGVSRTGECGGGAGRLTIFFWQWKLRKSTFAIHRYLHTYTFGVHYKICENRSARPFYQLHFYSASKNGALGTSIGGRLGPHFHNNITEFSQATSWAAAFRGNTSRIFLGFSNILYSF